MPSYDVRELVAIFVGGAVGALARSGLAQWIPPRAGHWPWVTFGVNVAGAFLLGYFATRLQERLPLSAYRRPLLGTGLCGALTTFSTMQVELLRMLDRGSLGLAAGVRGRERAGRVRGGVARHRARAAGTGGRMRVLVWVGRGAARRRRRARCASASTASSRSAWRATEFPLGHVRGEHQRRASCSGCWPARRCTATPCCSPARPRSAPTRRSPPGCSRRTGWARTASCGLAVLNVVLSLVARRGGRRARAGSDRLNEDCLKLTIYFGERDRAGGSFLADALLDLFGRERWPRACCCAAPRASGPSSGSRPSACCRCPRTCRWWRWRWTRASGSRRSLPEVSAVTGDGLVTLERARLLTGPLEDGRRCPAPPSSRCTAGAASRCSSWCRCSTGAASRAPPPSSAWTARRTASAAARASSAATRTCR